MGLAVRKMEERPASASTAELSAALEAIVALSDVLVRERAAVAKLDAEALDELAVDKERLVARLRPIELLASSIADPRLRAQVREAARKLRAQAEANAALLGDAITAISEALGLRQSTGTYDAHARLRSGVRAWVGKRA